MSNIRQPLPIGTRWSTLGLAFLLFSMAHANAAERCGIGIFMNAFGQIESVIPGSPADKAGIKVGDIPYVVDGIMTVGTAQIQQQIQKANCDDTITLTLTNISGLGRRTVVVTLEKVDFRASVLTRVFPIPSSYPPLPESLLLQPLGRESARKAKLDAGGLRENTREEFPRGFYLGKKNFEGEGKRKFATHLLTGVQIGKSELRFYLVTPYTEARYRFYEAAKQFESYTEEEAVSSFGEMGHAYVVVLQSAATENLSANLAGFGSLTSNTAISKVVIRRDGTVYESIGRDGAGWAFPLSVFTKKDIEIIAVSQDNLHATLKPSGTRWSKVR